MDEAIGSTSSSATLACIACLQFRNVFTLQSYERIVNADKTFPCQNGQKQVGVCDCMEQQEAVDCSLTLAMLKVSYAGNIHVVSQCVIFYCKPHTINL